MRGRRESIVSPSAIFDQKSLGLFRARRRGRSKPAASDVPVTRGCELVPPAFESGLTTRGSPSSSASLEKLLEEPVSRARRAAPAKRGSPRGRGHRKKETP